MTLWLKKSKEKLDQSINQLINSMIKRNLVLFNNESMIRSSLKRRRSKRRGKSRKLNLL